MARAFAISADYKACLLAAALSILLALGAPVQADDPIAEWLKQMKVTAETKPPAQCGPSEEFAERRGDCSNNGEAAMPQKPKPPRPPKLPAPPPFEPLPPAA